LGILLDEKLILVVSKTLLVYCALELVIAVITLGYL